MNSSKIRIFIPGRDKRQYQGILLPSKLLTAIRLPLLKLLTCSGNRNNPRID